MRGLVYKVVTFTIDISEDDQVSQEVRDIGGFTHFALETPAALTSTAIRFQASSTGDGTFTPLVDDATGARISVTCETATAETIALEGDDISRALAALRFIKLDMGSAELADRTIKLHCHQ